MKRNKSVWRKGLIITVCTFVGLCGIGGLILQRTDIGQAAASRDKNFEEFRALGLVTSLEEYEKQVEIPDNENAAVLLLPIVSSPKAAFLSRLYPQFKSKTLVDAPPTQSAPLGRKVYIPTLPPLLDGYALTPPIEPEDRVQLLALQKEISPLLERPFRGFILKAKDRKELEFPNCDYLTRMFYGLRSLAVEQHSQGKVKDCVVSLKQATTLANWIDDSGFAFAIFLREKRLRDLEFSIRYLLLKTPTDRDFLKGLNLVLAVASKDYAFDKTLIAESLYASNDVKATRAGTRAFLDDEEGSMAIHFTSMMRTPILGRALESRVYECFVKGKRIAPVDSSDIEGHVAALSTVYNEGGKEALSYQLVNHTTLGLGLLEKSVPSERAQLNVLRQAVEAARIKLETGKYPTKLPLTGEAERDYSAGPGKTLKLDTTKGFRVWSVGINGNDDGGIRDYKKKWDDFAVNLK